MMQAFRNAAKPIMVVVHSHSLPGWSGPGAAPAARDSADPSVGKVNGRSIDPAPTSHRAAVVRTGNSSSGTLIWKDPEIATRSGTISSRTASGHRGPPRGIMVARQIVHPPNSPLPEFQQFPISRPTAVRSEQIPALSDLECGPHSSPSGIAVPASCRGPSCWRSSPLTSTCPMPRCGSSIAMRLRRQSGLPPYPATPSRPAVKLSVRKRGVLQGARTIQAASHRYLSYLALPGDPRPYGGYPGRADSARHETWGRPCRRFRRSHRRATAAKGWRRVSGPRGQDRIDSAAVALR